MGFNLVLKGLNQRVRSKRGNHSVDKDDWNFLNAQELEIDFLDPCIWIIYKRRPGLVSGCNTVHVYAEDGLSV
jgi:hypothetical protein